MANEPVNFPGWAPGYQNAGGTVPVPAPDGKTQPVGVWTSEINPLLWEAGTDPVVRQSTWGSPLFDFRPELRANDGKEIQAVPVWRTGNGAGGHLQVVISNLRSFDRTSLRVLSAEWGHPTDSFRVQQTIPPTDITASLSSGVDSAILTFWPPGSGYPCRYWRVKVYFQIYSVLAADPPLAVTAGYY